MVGIVLVLAILLAAPIVLAIVAGGLRHYSAAAGQGARGRHQSQGAVLFFRRMIPGSSKYSRRSNANGTSALGDCGATKRNGRPRGRTAGAYHIAEAPRLAGVNYPPVMQEIFAATSIARRAWVAFENLSVLLAHLLISAKSGLLWARSERPGATDRIGALAAFSLQLA